MQQRPEGGAVDEPTGAIDAGRSMRTGYPSGRSGAGGDPARSGVDAGSTARAAGIGSCAWLAARIRQEAA